MAAVRGKPTGRCTACSHPERVRFELLLAGGASYRAVADKFHLGPYALRRHWINHVSEERRMALTLGPVQREALASRVAEESTSVIDHFRAVRAGLYSLYDAAVTAGDGTTGATVAGRLLECLNSMARLTGQLAASPLVQYNTQNNYLQFSESPEFIAFMERVTTVLEPYPEARLAIFHAVRALDQQDGAVELVPQLEDLGAATAA